MRMSVCVCACVCVRARAFIKWHCVIYNVCTCHVHVYTTVLHTKMCIHIIMYMHTTMSTLTMLPNVHDGLVTCTCTAGKA